MAEIRLRDIPRETWLQFKVNTASLYLRNTINSGSNEKRVIELIEADNRKQETRD